ncbi:hypothetical protein ACUNV4_12995 [Granulosicoccus sp. 3-233]|uniref:hypothetical protein n=1 Tax=Granulosicoccus sp. 3-233 TaxID=3417969 RepID=UPI003D341362
MSTLSVMANRLLRAGHGSTSTFMLRTSSIAVLAFLGACASRPYYDYPPPMPQSLEPVAGAELRAGEPVEFSWRRADDTESYDFHVFNAENSDISRYMKTGLLAADICTADRCSLHLYLSLPDSSRHAWRVRSSNNAGKSAWTRTLFTFTGGTAR